MSLHVLSKSDRHHSFLSAPICVIGAGIAGLLLARRLARAGQRVVVVESGYASFDAGIHALNEIEDPAGRYSRGLTGRYRGLGGTSSRWGGRMIPISGHEAGARPYLNEAGWPFPVEILDAYNEELEELFGTGGGSYDESALPSLDRNEFFPRVDPSIRARWAKCPTFKRCNVADLVRDDLSNRQNIEIWLGATVCDFEMNRATGRLKGVLAKSPSGKKLTVRADQFVIASGTIETTRLLLLMDVATDNQAFAHCKVLGRYFQDHLKSEVATISRHQPFQTNRLFGYRFLNATRRDLHLELSGASQQDDAVGSAFAYVAMELGGSPLGYFRTLARGLQQHRIDPRTVLQASTSLGFLARSLSWRFLRKQLFIPANIDFQLMACVEQLPNASNRIRLAEKRDGFGVPKTLLEWRPMAAEERSFRSIIKHLAAYWTHAGFDRVCPLQWTDAAQDASIPIIDRAEACAHPSGSTRMGTNPAESVVGPDLRCHAIPNVSVVSASVFPTAGSANPTFTIMRLALRLADSHLQQLARPGSVSSGSLIEPGLDAWLPQPAGQAGRGT